MEENKRKNPWLGLESYQEGEVLYGRDDDIRDLTQSVLNDTNTLLYGKSGIGKSSILNAGIIPAARRHGYLPVLIRLSHKEQHTYLHQVKEAIANAMMPLPLDEAGNRMALKEAGQKAREAELDIRIREVIACKDNKRESLYEYFHRHTFHAENGERIKLLIIFDQFEEIFTLQENELKKKHFFAELADLLNDVVPTELQHEVVAQSDVQEEVKVIDTDNFDDLFNDLDLDVDNETPEYVTDNEIHLVFTIREDFLSEFEYYSASIPSLKQNRYGLRPINEEQAALIILRPMPGLISESVARLIIEKVTGRKDFELDGIPEIEVDSAVLSLYLNRLYDAKKDDSITAELVEQKGGEIIADFYSDAISNVSDATIEYLEDRLLNGQNRRDNITIYDAVNDGNVTEEELNILCNKKKILRQFNYAGDLRIEYVHDILCPVVQAHKEERILVKLQEEERKKQEEERKKQEEEKLRFIQEEKRKRKEIERKSEEEKARLKAEAMRVRRRNHRRLYAIGSFVVLLILGIGIYYWYYEWKHESYYVQFERVNGWPTGVGKELTYDERSTTPLYYKLSHKGHLDHDTDVEVLSSNGALPLYPRIKVLEVDEDDVNDIKAKAYYNLLFKVARIHFVEGENNKIDKEIALDENGATLWVVSYFHLQNGKEAWAQFVTATGQAMQIRDDEVDRIKLSWYKNDNDRNDPNNGRIESLMYFDAQGICRPTAKNICGYMMKFRGNNTIYQYALDEYGRTMQTDYNVLITRQAGDTLETRYAKAYSTNDSVPQQAIGPEGYTKTVVIDNVTHLYVDNSAGPVATRQVINDKNGNPIEEKTVGIQPVPYPAHIKYSYAANTGYLTGFEKYDINGAPFVTLNDSIYKKHWEYTDKGELMLEEFWNGKNRVYYHQISHTQDVLTDVVEDHSGNVYLTRIDSILPAGVSTSYYGKNKVRVKFKSVEGEDTLEYHRMVTKSDEGNKTTYYFTLDKENRVVPCPKVFDSYGKAISFFCKEQGFDKDGNQIYYKLYDEEGTIIKSMMRFYQNGQPVARAVMGVDGYGHPVRCPRWEEEGYAYYKLYYSKDFNNRYVSIKAVDEWEIPSVFYDASEGAYRTITYKDYKGADITLNGERTNIFYSYRQYSLDKATDITSIHLPYLHILDVKSDLYLKGLRDGDRIVQLGSWKLGMSNTVLSSEWDKLGQEEMTIKVLRPSGNTFETITRNVKRTCVNEEEYHIYALTINELERFNDYNNK